MNIFEILLIQPTVNSILFFYNIFQNIGLPFAFGFSLIALTVSVRLLLHPFFHQQIKMTKKMEEVKPQMAKLTEKHKDDKKKLVEEQSKLYKEMGINPAMGCLFAIVQLPIFISLYQVLTKFVGNGHNMSHIVADINKYAYATWLKVQSLDPNFFGINLWVMPSQFQQHGYFYLVIPLITAALQYFQVALSTPSQKPALATTNKEEKKSGADDMQAAMMTQMKYIFPVMIGYFSFTLPVGLSLYWDIFSIFSIVQYVIYNKKNKI